MTMNLPDKLLSIVLSEARSIGLPIADRISPTVRINRRAVRRLGCCIREGDGYHIELSARMLSASETDCRAVLAHELLHTCPGCMNHGNRWKRYATQMREAFGYEIKRTADTAQTPPARYRVTCAGCGGTLFRYRASALIRHPERYRCRCGGTFFVTEEKGNGNSA